MTTSRNTRSLLLRAAAMLAASFAMSALLQAADPTPVPNANTKAPGIVASDILSVELIQTAVAQGSMRLETPRPWLVITATIPMAR